MVNDDLRNTSGGSTVKKPASSKQDTQMKPGPSVSLEDDETVKLYEEMMHQKPLREPDGRARITPPPAQAVDKHAPASRRATVKPTPTPPRRGTAKLSPPPHRRATVGICQSSPRAADEQQSPARAVEEAPPKKAPNHIAVLQDDEPFVDGPFTELPTPSLLAASQRRFAALGRGHPVDKETGIPHPFPPPTIKKDIFNKADYIDVDRRAQRVPTEVMNGPLQDVVDYLIPITHNDIGKVRSFFVWIASQDDPNYKVIFNTKLDNALNKAMMARTNCFSYNKLLENMCALAHIPCEIVQGGAKGYENEDATDFPLDTHHWCMVYVDGWWRFIDQSFGSECIQRSMAADEEGVPTTAAAVAEADSEKTSYIGEDHFLTDPELFIYKHFPQNEDKQLLARPITHTQFGEMAVVNKSYFDWQFEDMSEPRSNITTDTGELTIWFKTKLGQHPTMSYALFGDIAGSKDADKPDKHLNDLVRLENKDGRKIFTLHFKHIGRYRFKILVQEKNVSPDSKLTVGNNAGTSIRELVKYGIYCTSPYFKNIETPTLPLGLMELGAGATWNSLGIQNDHEGGIITAKRGLATLKLQCRSDIRFNFHLKRNDSSPLLENCFLIEPHATGTNVYVKLPSHGTFVLKAFTGKLGETSLCNTCTFLIESDRRCVPDQFPKILQTVGPLSPTSLVTKPVNYPGSYLTIPGGTKEFRLELFVRAGAFFLIKLMLWNGEDETDLSDYVTHQTTVSLLQVSCRFKYAGDYVMRIFSKPNADETSFALAWKGMLMVENPTIEFLPYPERLKDFHHDVQLISPTGKILQQSTEILFEVIVPPKVKKVKVMKLGEQRTTVLKKSGNRFTATVNTLLEQAQIVLYAEVNEDEVEQYFRFDVVSPAKLAEMDEECKTKAGQAKSQHAEFEQQRKQEKADTASRELEEMKQEQLRMAEFDSNKEELFAKQAIIEEAAKEMRFKAKLLGLKITPSTLTDMLEAFDDNKNIHYIIIAALLLLGYSEDMTVDIESCKEIFFAATVDNILERMMSILLKKIHPEIMARTKQFLRQSKWLDLKENNPSGGIVYEWVQDCCDSFKGDISVEAADDVRQRDIFSKETDEK